MASGIQAETQVPPRGDLEGAPPAEKLSPPRGDLEGAPPAEKLAPPRGGREGANPRGVGGGSYFTPFMAGWGWGTWRDRWNGHFLHFDTRGQALQGLSQEMLSSIEYGGVFPCLKDLDRRPIPWDICWSIAIRKAGGLCLYPSQTLVRNIGLTGGTHYGHLPEWTTRLLQHYDYDRPPYEGPIEVSHQEPAVNPAVEAAMQEALTDWGIRYTTLGRLLRRIYYWVKGKR